MIIFLKFFVFIILAAIVYQDFKDRLVWWFLYPILGLLGGYLFYSETFDMVYIYAVGINLFLTSIVMFLVWLYVKLIVKKPFFKEAFGLGDAFILVAFSFMFPTHSFVVFLFFSLLFSISIHLVLNRFRVLKTAPLAGYIALFLIGIYALSWAGIYQSLYLL